MRVFDPGATVAESRTVATVVVLIVSLWTLSILARPLRAWKVALVGAMVAIAAVVVLVPAIGQQIFLLEISPDRLLGALVMGALGIVLVEAVHRISDRVADGQAGRIG